MNLPWLWAVPAALGAAGGIRLIRRMTGEEPHSIAISEHEVCDERLPPELDGLRICQLSDLHLTDPPRNERAITEAVQRVRADLYLLTGDMVYRRAGIPVFFDWVDRLGESIRPAVAILGNAEHKREIHVDAIVSGMKSRGITTLVNESIRLPIRGASLQIVGVDDPHEGFSDFPAAYEGADPKRWTLLLCHSPDGLADLNGYRADLTLCGHTHGGQVRLPGIGALSANTRRVRGLISGWYSGEEVASRARLPESRTRLYISRGLGTSGFPGRLNCQPELPVFTLRSCRKSSGLEASGGPGV